MQRETDSSVLKADARGRVLTVPERREQLLDEFERSGLSGAKFAALTGLKYPTFAAWVQRRRRHRGAKGKINAPAEEACTVRWLEAVVQQAGASAGSGRVVLQVHLPGGGRLEVASVEQVPLAAALLRAMETPPASC